MAPEKKRRLEVRGGPVEVVVVARVTGVVDAARLSHLARQSR